MSLYGDSSVASTASAGAATTGSLQSTVSGSNAHDAYCRFGLRYLAITQLITILVIIAQYLQYQANDQEPLKFIYPALSAGVSLSFVWAVYSLSKRERPGLLRFMLLVGCLSLIHTIVSIYFWEVYAQKVWDSKVWEAARPVRLSLSWFGSLVSNGGSLFGWLLRGVNLFPSLKRSFPSALWWGLLGLDRVLLVAFWAWAVKRPPRVTV